MSFEPPAAGAKSKPAVARHPVPMLPCGKVEPKEEEASDDADDAGGGDGGDDKDPEKAKKKKDKKEKGRKEARKHTKARHHRAFKSNARNVARSSPARGGGGRRR